ncbi:DNA-binding protein [Sutterella sp.]|uniref:DNA-binding protein n=1 Tax=Sutterella sp. TaxID=1981025 RepID=UPI003FD7C768
MSTRAKVFAHLDKVASEGMKLPSIRELREELGGGSLSTLAQAVKDWKTEHAILNEIEDEKISLDPQTAQTVIDAIWMVFKPILRSRIDAQRAEYEAVVVKLREDLDAAHQALVEEKKRNAELEKALQNKSPH